MERDYVDTAIVNVSEHGTTEKAFKKIKKFLTQIIQEMKCNHYHHDSNVCAVCVRMECRTGLLCPECLTEDISHSHEHSVSVVPIDKFFKNVMDESLKKLVLQQAEINEVDSFYNNLYLKIQAQYSVKILLRD